MCGIDSSNSVNVMEGGGYMVHVCIMRLSGAAGPAARRGAGGEPGLRGIEFPKVDGDGMDVTVLQGVLAGAGLVAALLFGVWRMIEAQRKENREAHAAITENVKSVDERAERRAEGHRTALEGHRTALEAIARDVSFLAGRQAERDRK